MAATETTKASAAPFVAFAGSARLATGDLADVAAAAWRTQQQVTDGPVLVFNRASGEVVDLDLRGSEAEVLARYSERPAAPRRGRPSLGVVAREVTLLPRHWDWLTRQPGGASTSLRRLVEAARKADVAAARERTDVVYRFMAVVAGDLPGFEEAARALFAGNRNRLDHITESWPPDVRDELLQWLNEPFPQEMTA